MARPVSNGRGKALVIEGSEEGLEFTIEDEEGGEYAGIVVSDPEAMMDIFHELVTVLRELGADISLKFTTVPLND